MKNEDNTHSKRYYLFRHVPGSVEDTVMYRDSTGSWYVNFDKANLWADYNFLMKKAAEIKASENSHGVQHNYCIGQVDIEVNGFFPITVV